MFFKLVVGFLFSMIVNTSWGQLKDSVFAEIDTLKFYYINLSFQTNKYGTTYKVNDKKVSPGVYFYYENYKKNLEKCTPCYLKTYDIDEHLLSEGEQYSDCQVGSWTEYYPNGDIKVKGNHKLNDTGNWENIWNRGYCSVKDGNWLYYDKNGKLEKTEKYKDGVLVL